MKIVQAAGWYYPDSLGGTEVYVAALARHLRAAGHQVFVAAPEPGAAGPRTYEIEETQVFRYPIPLDASRDEAQGDTVVRGAEHLHRWLTDLHADVVHFHTFVTGLGFAEIAAAKQAGSRVVATTHSSSLGFLCQRGTLMFRGREMCDGIVDTRRCAECELEHRGAGAAAAQALASVPPAIASLARRLPGPVGTAMAMTNLIERNMARQRAMLDAVDAFVVLTQRAADIVMANGAPPGKVAVNRLGIRDIDTPPAPRRNVRPRVRIGYVGRFDPIKGVLDLAAAILRLSRDLPVNIEFRGPAQTPADKETRAAITRMVATDPRVTLAEPFPPASVVKVIGAYDVVCLPSRCLEGGPTAGLEAMAAGVPVIAATSSGVAEVIEDGVNGRLVPPGDVDRLAEAIAEVASCPEQTIDCWRKRLPEPRRMRDVASDYLELYGRRD
jgi:glycosyltransferase involved in cell wall biosynthesis